MREMIISELTQALHDIARGFAHFLPRLIVMLILAFVGWLIAYVVKVVLRSILRLIKFDKLSENAGASQLLTKAALPSATEDVEPVRVLGHLARLHSAGGECAGNPGPAGASRKILSVPAASVRSDVHPVFRTAGGQLLPRAALLAAVNANVPSPRVLSLARPQHHYCFRIVHRL